MLQILYEYGSIFLKRKPSRHPSPVKIRRTGVGMEQVGVRVPAAEPGPLAPVPESSVHAGGNWRR